MNATEVEPPVHGFTLHLGVPSTVSTIPGPAAALWFAPLAPARLVRLDARARRSTRVFTEVSSTAT